MATTETAAPPVFFTPQQVMAMFGLNRHTVYGMIANGRLPAIRVGVSGQMYRIPLSAIQSMIDSGAVPVVAADEGQGQRDSRRK